MHGVHTLLSGIRASDDVTRCRLVRRTSSAASAHELRVSVVIGTAGRAATLSLCLEAVRKQTQPAEEVIVVASREDDLLESDQDFCSLIVFSPAGCAEKRNIGADASRVYPDFFLSVKWAYIDNFCMRIAANLAKALLKPSLNNVRRLQGNLLALRSVLCLRIKPEEICDI